MTLNLYIEGGGWMPFEVARHPNENPKSVEIQGVFNEDAIVTAYLSDFESVPSRYDYCLQLAYNPSCKFDCLQDFDGKKERRELYYWNKRKKAPEKQGKLLYGAMGPSVLRLMERDSDGEYVDIWQAVVNVKPNADRLLVMQKMVSEIFPVNPYLAMSCAWGLSKISVKKEWKNDSRISIWSALIEYEVTKSVFSRIAPHLQSMIASSASKIERHNAVVGVRYIRRFTPQVIRRVSHLVAAKGESSVDGRVCTSVFSDSNDIIAHRVIGDFLRRRLLRLEKIEREYRRFISAGKDEIADRYSGDDKKGYHKHALHAESETIKKIEKLKNSIGAMYLSGPWKELPPGPPVLSLSADAFQYGPHYRYVYSQLSDFAKMQFIWNSNEDVQGRRSTLSHELGSTEERPNQWIHNYTVIYEGWVFVRLLRAFELLGFGMLKQYQSCVVRNAIDAYMGQRHNTQFELFSQDADIKIELCYGCSFPLRRQGCKGFCRLKRESEKDKEMVDPLTPDFSIRISRIDSDSDSYALVLDAKSGRMLNTWDIKKRDDYENLVLKNFANKLDHVWLVYAGESDSKKEPRAGIEFSSPLDGKECWNDNGRWHGDDCAESPCSKNGEFMWSRAGISQGGRMRKFSSGNGPFVGHLRANSVTVERSDVFEEFVEGIVNTARHVLGC